MLSILCSELGRDHRQGPFSRDPAGRRLISFKYCCYKLGRADTVKTADEKNPTQSLVQCRELLHVGLEEEATVDGDGLQILCSGGGLDELRPHANVVDVRVHHPGNHEMSALARRRFANALVIEERNDLVVCGDHEAWCVAGEMEWGKNTTGVGDRRGGRRREGGRSVLRDLVPSI